MSRVLTRGLSRRTSNSRLLLTGATAIVAAAAIPLSFVGAPALRLAGVGVFLLTGPGSAIVLALKLNSGPARRWGNLLAPLLASMAIGLSIAISLVLSTAMVYAHLWNPPFAVSSLAVATLALLAWGTALNLRSHGPSHSGPPAGVPSEERS